MGAEDKISITLSEEISEIVRARVESGDYASPEAVVAAAVQFWQRELDVLRLREMIAEGIASGFEPHDGMESIKASARRRMATSGK